MDLSAAFDTVDLGTLLNCVKQLMVYYQVVTWQLWIKFCLTGHIAL